MKTKRYLPQTGGSLSQPDALQFMSINVTAGSSIKWEPALQVILHVNPEQSLTPFGTSNAQVAQPGAAKVKIFTTLL